MTSQKAPLIDFSQLTISRTQILDYLSCGYRWDLGYRRGIQSTKVRAAMDLGSANHMGMRYAIRKYAEVGPVKGLDKILNAAVVEGAEAWAKNERKLRGKFISSEQLDQLRAIQLEAVGIAKQGIALVELPEWEVAMWKGAPLVEVEIMTALPPWKGYRVIPDFVGRRRAERKTSGWWLVDWKTKDSFEKEDAEDINLQFATMQYVMEREIPTLEIEGSFLWQVKAQAPHEPKLNKPKGNNPPEMSRAAIVCTWELYKKALVENGLDPANYKDMQEKLDKVKWFSHIPQHRSSEQCDAVWNQIVVPASREMVKDPRIIRRWVHQPFACKGCWAREFCNAELFDDDTDFLLRTDYVDTRKPRKKMEMGEARRKFTIQG
jgi:hypothetical protein